MQSSILWLKTKLTDFRELIWPLLEPETEQDIIEANQEEDMTILVESANLQKAFELKSKIHDAEDDRRKGIESKAAIFISTISISTSIVVASNALISGSSENTIPIKIAVSISFILCIYTLRTVWFSVKALERGNYHLLGFRDINVEGNMEEYYKHLITVLAKKTKANYKTINSKVDDFTMAQAYYKRSIFIICAYAFFILIYCFFFSKPKTIEYQFKPQYTFHQSIIKNRININIIPDLLPHWRVCRAGKSRRALDFYHQDYVLPSRHKPLL